MRITFVTDAPAADPHTRMLNAATITPVDKKLNALKLMQDGNEKAEMIFQGFVTKEADNYFLNWHFTLSLPLGTTFAGAYSSPAGMAFEMDACVEDGTTNKPWNCLYTQMPYIPNSSPTDYRTTIYSDHKHVAQGDLPAADAQTDLSIIDFVACSLNKTFYNGR